MDSKQIKIGVIMSQVTLIVGTIVALIYTPIMLRMLGQSEYGLYTLVTSVVNYLNLLNLGFTSSYLRFYCQYNAEKDSAKVAQLNGTYITIFLVMGIVAIIIGNVLIFNLEFVLGGSLTLIELQKARILMIIMVYNMGLKLPMSVFNTFLAAKERHIFLKTVNLIKALVHPVLVIIILGMGYKSIGMLVITVAIAIVIEIINMYYSIVKLKMRFNFHNFSYKMIKELSAFSVFIFINMLVNNVNWNVDKYLLGILKGTGAVAVYGVAAKLNTYYLSISMSVTSVLTTRVNHMVAQKVSMRKITELITKIGRLQMLVLSCLMMGFMFFGKPFIIMWAGDAYKDAFYVLLILMLAVTIPSIQNLCYEVQKAKNLHGTRSLIYLGMAVVNIGISIPLIKIYGPTGAAIGTAVSIVFVSIFIMNFYYHYKVKLDMKYFWKEVGKLVPSYVLPLITGYLIVRYIDLYSIVNFLIAGVVFVSVFVSSSYFLGMNTYEKALMHKPFELLRNRFNK